MSKYINYLLTLILVIIGYLLFDFAYNINGVFSNILRILGAIVFMLTGMLIKQK